MTNHKETKTADAGDSRLADLVNDLPFMMGSLDENGTILSFAGGGMAMLGDAVQTLIGMSVFDAAHDYPELQSALRRGVAGEAVKEVIFLPGYGRYIELRCIPHRDAYGASRGTSVIAEVVSERTVSESALRESEERYRALVELSPLAVLVNRENRIEFANPTALRLFQASTAEDVVGKSPYDLFHPDYHDTMRARMVSVLEGKAAPVGINKIIRTDGAERLVEITAAPITTGAERAIQVIFWDITERERMERALRESEQRLRELAEASFEGIVFHRETVILDMNTRLEEIIGWTREEIVGRSVLDFVAPEYHGDVFSHLHERRSDPYEIELIHRGGRRVHVDVLGRRITQGGESARVTAVRDATNRRKAEAILRERASLLDLAHDAIIVRDWDDHVEYWSKGAETTYGYTAEQVKGRTLPEILKTQFPVPIETIKQLLLNSDAFECELVQQRKDGSPIVVASRWALQRDERGRPRGILQINRDITVRKAAEENLRASKEFAEQLVETANVMVVGLDCEGRITIFNRSAEELTGYSKSDALGRDWFTLCIPVSIQAQLRDVFTSGVRNSTLSREYENPVITRDGHERMISWQNSVILLPNGPGTISFGMDVTDQRRHEEQIRHHTVQLEREVERRSQQIRALERQRLENEKQAALGRMAARIAHEINNPLAGVKNSFLLIKRMIPTDHRNYEFANRIDREIERMARIVRQMFDLYRPSTEAEVEVRIPDMLRDVAALLEGNARLKRVRIELEAEQAEEMVWLHEDWLRQVLFSVIQNAIEASPSDSAIAIRGSISDSRLTISVQDHGSGIAPEIRATIFEPFFTTKSGLDTGGLGLGLPTAKGLIEAMGGTLHYESETGEGTTFILTVPVRRNEKEGDA